MSGHCNDCDGNPCICSEMRSAGIRIQRGANKAKRQRDNWKARYEEIAAMLRDDALANSAGMLRREHTSVQEARYAAIDDYRARLLAIIDQRKDAP